jgi:hypothetical protein
MKDMFDNRNCVGVFCQKRMYKMSDLACAPPFVTMTTYSTIFEVVFPKERPGDVVIAVYAVGSVCYVGFNWIVGVRTIEISIGPH